MDLEDIKERIKIVAGSSDEAIASPQPEPKDANISVERDSDAAAANQHNDFYDDPIGRFADMQTAKADALADIQAILGYRYEVIDLIGEGGMGSVFRVKQLFTGRIEAVKLLNHSASKSVALARFQQEAKAACSFNHPNAVAVYDFGMSMDGQPYMVMEYIEGTSISDWLKAHGPMDPEVVQTISSEVCAALGAAHERGIVHRDVKPSNIIISQTTEGNFTVKVVDFGIAKILTASGGADMSLTATGEVFGSPLYMSPEQCTGKTVDARSDIYSLGCVMYEMLTGSPPHSGDNALATMYNRLNEEVIPFRKMNPNIRVSSELEEVVLKALEKDAPKRFQTMEELQSQLHRKFSYDENAQDHGKKREKRLPSRLAPGRVNSIPISKLIVISVILGVLLAVVSSGWKLYNDHLNPYSDAQDFDKKSYLYFSSGQYEKAIPLLEFGISTYRDQIDTAIKSKHRENLRRDEILLAENFQHVGKCYLELAKKAEANKSQIEATSLYNKAHERYTDAVNIWKKHDYFQGSDMPAAFHESAIVLEKLGLTAELEQLRLLAKQKKISLD